MEAVSQRHHEHAPQAAILFDKFHIMRHLGEALDKVRKAEYARLSGRDRRFIKGQKYTLLSHRENLSLDGRKSLRYGDHSGGKSGARLGDRPEAHGRKNPSDPGRKTYRAVNQLLVLNILP